MKLFILLMFCSLTATAGTLDDAVKEFWDCEYASTQGTVDLSNAADCSIAFERVKNEKFKGNFGEMLKWWRLQKEAEMKKRSS